MMWCAGAMPELVDIFGPNSPQSPEGAGASSSTSLWSHVFRCKGKGSKWQVSAEGDYLGSIPTPPLWVYTTCMLYPTCMRLPHLYASTPHLCVYPTSMRIPHLYAYTPPLCVYSTFNCLIQLRTHSEIENENTFAFVLSHLLLSLQLSVRIVSPSDP